VLRIRHAARLTRELAGFAVLNRVGWFIPVVLLLALLISLVVVGAAAAPYTIYPLF